MVNVYVEPTKATEPPPPPPPTLPPPSPITNANEDSSNWASEFLNNKAQLPLTDYDFKTFYLFAYMLVAILLFCYVSFKLYRACQRNVLKKRLKAE